MFTLDQIGAAIRKVKSFMEYPSLLDDMKEIGVIKYDNFNDDGLSIYYGADNYRLDGRPKFTKIEVSDKVDVDFLKDAIVRHKNEETNFLDFSKEMAQAGAKIWSVDVNTKEITYFDNQGFEILKIKV